MAHTIVTPLPGTFYRKPAPDKDNFVEEGGTVEVGQVIGLVEIMKQFVEITADQAGVLSRFLVDSGAMVNPGDTIAELE